MTTPSHEHDDDLEPTVTEDELEVERYDVEDGTPSGDAKDSWRPAGAEPSAPHEDAHEDEADDSL